MSLDGLLRGCDGGDENVGAGEAGEHGEGGGRNGEEVLKEGFIGVGFGGLDGLYVTGESIDVGWREERQGG